MGKRRKPRTDGEYANVLYNYIRANPGKNAYAVARGVNFKNPNNIYARLTTMDGFGLLLYEDDKGHLYVFEG